MGAKAWRLQCWECMQPVDFDRAPFLVIWETTLACELSCRHCRASAIPTRMPGELDTNEGKRLIDDVAAMGTPLIVFSGGDPGSRMDLAELIAHAKSRGLRAATVPAATSYLSHATVRALKESGCDQMAVSLDFPDAARHDAFRGHPGVFARTIEAAAWAREEGLPFQVNTCVFSESADSLDEMADRVAELGAVFWEVFFLVPTGRGSALSGLTPARCEELFGVLHRAQQRHGYVVKVTEAPHYRRYLRMRNAVEHGRAAPTSATNGAGITGLARRGTNAGNGFLFVSHLGHVMPSGFLPLPVGNVRTQNIAEIYRESPFLKDLRNPERLGGKCGVCPFRIECGGSRARAYAMTLDPFAADPWCAYQPPVPARSSPIPETRVLVSPSPRGGEG